MASIGTLGTIRDAVELDFEYFGYVIKVNPDASDLDLVEFMMTASTVDEVDEKNAMIAVGSYLRNLIDPADWQTFWQASKANRQNMTDLMQTAQAIVEAVSGFPTGQPGDSSSGPPSTNQKSAAAGSPAGRATTSSQRRAAARTRRAQQLEADTRQALETYQGRPDLQLIVADTHTARTTGLAG